MESPLAGTKLDLVLLLWVRPAGHRLDNIMRSHGLGHLEERWILEIDLPLVVLRQDNGTFNA